MAMFVSPVVDMVQLIKRTVTIRQRDAVKAACQSRDGGVIKITSKEFVIEKGSQKIALLLCRFVW